METFAKLSAGSLTSSTVPSGFKSAMNWNTWSKMARYFRSLSRSRSSTLKRKTASAMSGATDSRDSRLGRFSRPGAISAKWSAPIAVPR